MDGLWKMLLTFDRGKDGGQEVYLLVDMPKRKVTNFSSKERFEK